MRPGMPMGGGMMPMGGMPVMGEVLVQTPYGMVKIRSYDLNHEQVAEMVPEVAVATPYGVMMEPAMPMQPMYPQGGFY